MRNFLRFPFITVDSTENSIPSLSMPRIINSRNASKPQRIQSKTLNMSEQNRAIIYKSKHWSEKNIRNSFTESKKEIEKPVTNKSVYKIGYITSRLEVQNLEKLAISLKSINNEFHDSVFKDAMKFLDIKQKIKLESVCKSFQTISNQTLREQDVIILKGCSMNGSEKTETTDHCLKYSRHLSHSFDEITNSFAINDLVKDKSFVSVIQKCPNLKCLQLSYCKINFEIMESIKTCLQLKCLHIDHIFGIDSEEEWTKIGECIGTKLNYLTFNADSLKCDLSRMVSKMSSLKELTLKEYGKDYVSLFSNMGTNVKKLSLINYYNLDDKAIQALNASRLGNKITDLEIFYNKVHTKRSNINGLFQSICHYMSDLKALKFKFLSSPNIEPLFQLKSLVDLSIHFSLSRLIDIEPNTPLNKLKNLILSQVIFTPRRMYAMVKAFPNLEKLSISGKANSGNIDSAVFCCECDAQDKYEDTCFVCYKSCSLALTQFNELKTLQLNYIKMKYSLALVFPFIFKIETISLKPYQCKCGLSIIQSCIKIAESKPIYLEIKESFISEALGGKELPENFRIIKLK
jgi:hypothetical protein